MSRAPNKSELLTQIKAWDSLWELPTQAKATGGPPPKAPSPAASTHGVDQPLADLILSGEAHRLANDCVCYLHDGCVEHQGRSNLSVRKFEQAKAELETRGLIRVVSIGQTLFLAPTEALYAGLRVEPPRLRRRLSFEHSFAVGLAAHLLRQDPCVHSVAMEVPLGDSGSTIDAVARLKDGAREAWEVTLSAGNVAAHAAKCRQGGFARIVFLCRDTNIKQAAWSGLHNAGLEPELLARCHCVLFSTLLKKRQAMRTL